MVTKQYIRSPLPTPARSSFFRLYVSSIFQRQVRFRKDLNMITMRYRQDPDEILLI